MEIKVYWTDFAKKQLQYIFDYHHDKASLKIALKIVKGIVGSVKILSLDPEIGQVEGLLIQRKENFRYLIFTNYKIIYWINKDKQRVEIVDVFDVRQNPIKIKRKK